MKPSTSQIAFRYRPRDSATGVTQATAKRLAEVLGADETQVIHLALRDLATKFLPQYEADEGTLTKTQLNQIKKISAQDQRRHRSQQSFELEST